LYILRDITLLMVEAPGCSAVMPLLNVGI